MYRIPIATEFMKLVDEHHNEPYNDIDDIDFYRKKTKDKEKYILVKL